MKETTSTEDTIADRKLSQRIGAFSSQEFSLLEDKLLYRFRGLTSQNEFAVSLREIDPDPLRITQRPWGWYVATVVLLLCIGGCIVGEMNVSRQNSGAYAFLAIVLGVFVIVGMVQSYNQTVNVYVFRSSRGNVVFHATRPDLQTCQAFVRQLQNAASDATSIEKQLTQSLLRVLHAEGFLDKWQFEKAKQRFEVTDGE